jgi:hypothetical protein
MDREVLVRVLGALEARGVDYAVFGAVALNLHGIVRATQDLDIFVAPDRANVERLKQALRDVIADPSIEEISADDLLGDYPAVQYTPPDESFYIDILTRPGDAFEFADLERERVPFGDLTVTVVTARTLFDMKKDTPRPKDRLDAHLTSRAVRTGVVTCLFESSDRSRRCLLPRGTPRAIRRWSGPSTSHGRSRGGPIPGDSRAACSGSDRSTTCTARRRRGTPSTSDNCAAAAPAANRELMTRLRSPVPHRELRRGRSC